MPIALGDFLDDFSERDRMTSHDPIPTLREKCRIVCQRRRHRRQLVVLIVSALLLAGVLLVGWNRLMSDCEFFDRFNTDTLPPSQEISR